MPFMVGGAYALFQYSGIERHTKDLDLFVRKTDAEEVLKILARAGYKSEMTFSHWLGKAFKGDNFIDVIFSSGNGVADVDDECSSMLPTPRSLVFQLKSVQPKR